MGDDRDPLCERVGREDSTGDEEEKDQYSHVSSQHFYEPVFPFQE